MWDPQRYLEFEAERARPFRDLVRALPPLSPRWVVDVGCGPGSRTASLAARWPEATIVGLDPSLPMLARARRNRVPGQVLFAGADVRAWQPALEVDLILSNACFHWIADHRTLLQRLVAALRANGVLAFQVPDTAAQPSHRIVRELLATPPFSGQVPRWPQPGVERPEWYLAELAGLGLQAEAWTTVYHHVLAGTDPVLRWLEGTTLRPVLAQLSELQGERLRDALRPRLEAAYPRRSFGTVFSFQRLFVVARRPDPGPGE